MTHKALYICYFGIDEPLVQTQVLPYLRELRKDGTEIQLLTFEPGPKNETSGKLNTATSKRLSSEGIEWHSLRYHKWPSVPATAYDVLAGVRFIRSLLKGVDIDILHARSHVPMLIAALARKYSQRKPKLLFDIRGFFPEEYTDAGIWPEGGWLYRTAKRVESWLMKQADGFVVLTEKARSLLFPESGETGLDRLDRPVEVIPCCVDLERFAEANSASRASIRGKLAIDDRKVLVYVGSFGGWYLTDEMVDLFAAFKHAEPDGFAMILTQSKSEMVETKLLESGYSKNAFFIGKVHSAEIPRYLSAADLAVSFIKPCYSKQASSPTKNAEYLICGLPIIANAGVGDVEELIADNEVGAIVRDLNANEYLHALRELLSRDDLSEKCREVARREFDLQNVGGFRYRRLYSRLLEKENVGR